MDAYTILQYGHQTVLDAIEGLPEREWNTPGVCGVWSVKEIMAHLASFEQVLVDVLRQQLRETATPHLDLLMAQGDDFNDLQVAVRQDRTVTGVWEEYTAAYTEVLALAKQIPAETFRKTGTLPWYGQEYALDDLIVYMFYGHKREHCAQIMVFRDHLAR